MSELVDEKVMNLLRGVDAHPQGEENAQRSNSRAEMIAALLVPMTDLELEDSRTPHPHVFQAGERGLFPRGEVAVIGARGREGKTTVAVGIAVALAIGHSVAGLVPPGCHATVIYSAEDSRAQYARKIAAQVSILSPKLAEQVKQNVLVPDMDSPEMATIRSLITVADHSPISTGTDTAIIEAILPLMRTAQAPALMIFETASTLSDAEEDTRGHKALVACLKRIARALDVAVVLVHHTSQAADNNLHDLSISTADIRGGTALVYNSRQNLMLVNLGSDADPFPDADARTVLRKIAAAGEMSRITALVCLDSSKGMDPAPAFFRWVQTAFGPAAVEHDPPAAIAGKSWRKVRQMVMAERGSQRTGAKASAQNVHVTTVVELVTKLDKTGRQPTTRAVSMAANKSGTWAKPYLEAAVEERLLVCGQETIPRTKGGGTVYRPIDSTVGRP